MARTHSGGPDADIRVDLLLIYPLLLVVTLTALWFGVRKGPR